MEITGLYILDGSPRKWNTVIPRERGRAWRSTRSRCPGQTASLFLPPLSRNQLAGIILDKSLPRKGNPVFPRARGGARSRCQAAGRHYQACLTSLREIHRHRTVPDSPYSICARLDSPRTARERLRNVPWLVCLVPLAPRRHPRGVCPG